MSVPEARWETDCDRWAHSLRPGASSVRCMTSVDVGRVVDVFAESLLSASRPEVSWTETSLLNALEWCVAPPARAPCRTAGMICTCPSPARAPGSQGSAPRAPLRAPAVARLLGRARRCARDARLPDPALAAPRPGPLRRRLRWAAPRPHSRLKVRGPSSSPPVRQNCKFALTRPRAPRKPRPPRRCPTALDPHQRPPAARLLQPRSAPRRRRGLPS